MRRRSYIDFGVMVLVLSLSVTSVATGAPRRFTPKQHNPDGVRPSVDPPTPDPDPDVPPPPGPVGPGTLTVAVDTASRIRSALVGPNRIEIQSNVPWRLIATAKGVCVLAEGGPTGAVARYITLPEDAVAYWVTAR